MLLEGTTLGCGEIEPTQSEHDLVDELASHMQETKGIVLAAFSGQNPGLQRHGPYGSGARPYDKIYRMA